MEKVNSKIIKTARKYAEALFDVAINNDATDSVLNDIILLSDTINESNELNVFLNNPVIEVSDKKSVLQEIFGEKICEYSMNFLLIIADNARFDAIEGIRYEYGNLLNSYKNIVEVKAVSAVEMKDFLKEKLKNKLENLLSKQTEIQYEINPDIIGGLVLELNGKTIDCSIQTQLKNIKKQLM